MKRVDPKDPGDILDYKFDWGSAANKKPWLESGETIVQRTVTVVDPGITRDSDGITDNGKTVTVWLSGGTHNSDYRINCAIVTSAGRTKQGTMLVPVREQ